MNRETKHRILSKAIHDYGLRQVDVIEKTGVSFQIPRFQSEPWFFYAPKKGEAISHALFN